MFFPPLSHSIILIIRNNVSLMLTLQYATFLAYLKLMIHRSLSLSDTLSLCVFVPKSRNELFSDVWDILQHIPFAVGMPCGC